MSEQLSMGVLNITPNSFSDGGKFSSISDFSKQFKSLQTWANIIDIGAESTAPFNDSISSLTEYQRFEETLFPFLLDNPDPSITLSIDTYKPEVFYEVYQFVKLHWPSTKIIFNDVSGCVDDELILLLSDDELDFDYVLAHNLCDYRSCTSEHMNYCTKSSGEDFFSEVVLFFKTRLALLSPFNNKIIIDPCFGFSKDRTQNHYLLKRMDDFCELFKDHQILYGISKKSFLRFPQMAKRDSDSEIIMEQMQSILIHDLLAKNKDKNLIFRLHSKHCIKSSFNIISILE